MGRGFFLTRSGIFTEGRVDVYPGLRLVASAPSLTHLSLKPSYVCLKLFSLTSWAPHVDGHPGSSAACACLLCVSHGFHGQNFLLRCCRVSVLDAIPSCVRTSLKYKARRWLCLLPNVCIWGGCPWAWPCLSCLSSKTERVWVVGWPPVHICKACQCAKRKISYTK